MSYKDKYLKYKEKDLILNNLTGGAVAPVVTAPDNSFKPVISGSIDELVEKIGKQDNIISPNLQDSWVWEPRRLNEGVDFNLVNPWMNNNNDPETADMPRTWAYVTLIRDVYVTVNNKKFKIKSGTQGDALIIQLGGRDIRKIVFSIHLMELVPESGCMVQ
jgi:hypothetical protein